MTSLLPPNRTPLEAAVSATIAGSFPRPAGAIAAVFDADSCPLDLLPFLAWELSVDLWDDDWSESTKRKACRDAYRLHALKTTLAGIREHVALTGATVVGARRPNTSAFYLPARDEATRRSWRESMPRVQLRTARQRGTAGDRAFLCAGRMRRWSAFTFDSDETNWTWDSDRPVLDMASADPQRGFSPSFHGSSFWQTSRGPDRLRLAATLVDGDTTRELPLRQLDDGALQVDLATPTARDFVGRGFLGAIRLTTTRAPTLRATMRLDDTAEAFAITRGEDPRTVRPDILPGQRIAPTPIAFHRGPIGGRFLRTTRAPELLLRQIAIHDPSRILSGQRSRAFHGAHRLGFTPFEAELRIAIPMTRPVARSFRWHGAGHLQAADLRPLANALEAIRVSKAFRDRILVDTALHRPVKFSRGRRFGTFTFGQIMEAS